jgi:small-conductance mechanosensitive channel
MAMFVECLVSGWIIHKIISPKFFIAKELKQSNWEFVLKLIPLLYLFIFISVIANIFGFVNLSRLLIDATVYSLFNLNILILVVMVMKQTIAVLLRTHFAQHSFIIRDNYHLIEKRLIQLTQFIGIFIWIRALFNRLGIYESLNNWFVETILHAKWEVGDSTIVFENILLFFLVIIATYLVYRALRELLKDEIYPRVQLPRGVPGAITMISGYIIAGYGIYIALIAAGVNLSTFGLVAGALGVGIGFGLQGIVANFIAGLVLAFERPIQVGDTIEIGTMTGNVTQIGVRASQIKTFDGSEVIVPNSSLITKDVTNWTLSDRRKRRDIMVSVAYGSDLHQVMDLLSEVANKHPDVLKIPAPWILFDGFGDNSLNFRVRIWTTMDSGMTTKSAVAINIYDALQSAGIEIPFPQRDLHLRSIDPSIKGFGSGKKSAAAKSKKNPIKQDLKSEVKRKPQTDEKDSTET